MFSLKNIFKRTTPAIPGTTPTIPRRDLTVKSTDLLNEILKSVLTDMLRESCPCHYPRFRELTSFLHDNYQAGPVFCADTNYLISIATDEKMNYLKELRRISDSEEGDYDDIIYRCQKCSTEFREVTRQYSINFEFSYFILEKNNYGLAIGAEVEKPFPLLQGLFGFSYTEVLKCATDFVLKDSEEYYMYLTKRSSRNF